MNLGRSERHFCHSIHVALYKLTLPFCKVSVIMYGRADLLAQNARGAFAYRVQPDVLDGYDLAVHTGASCRALQSDPQAPGDSRSVGASP